MAGYRIDRINEDIKRELCSIFRELKDPRVKDKMISIVRLEVSSDLSYAKVSVSAVEGFDAS
ncbi:MAG: ribosome-binding factor A, partial [Acutalibacteraceae bacterium]